MTPTELAAELGLAPPTLRAWLRATWHRPEPGTPWVLTEEQIFAARARWAQSSPSADSTLRVRQQRPHSSGRADSDEAYVIDQLEVILGQPALRQHRFPWLTGDAGRNGRAALPVDAYWPDRALVVEYRESQHDKPTPFFDKPDRSTVSGVDRGEQRRLYDERREALIPAHGLRLLIVRPQQLSADARGRLRRHIHSDRDALRALVFESEPG